MSSRLDGLEAGYALFGALPDAAKTQAEQLLQKIGTAVLREQQALVAVRTGDLKASLTVQEELDQLRVRVGVPGTEAVSKNTLRRQARERGAGQPVTGGMNYGDRFYALIVEYGRKAQTVTVTRGTTASPNSWSSRRRHNSPRKMPGPYTMNVSALAPRPFVNIDQRIQTVIVGYLDRFWSDVLGSVGA